MQYFSLLRTSRGFLFRILFVLALLLFSNYAQGQSTLKLYGQVIDKDGPVAGATIEVVGLNRQVKTDHDGYYYCYDIPPGQYYIFCRHNSLETLSNRKQTIDSRSSLRWDIFLGGGAMAAEPVYVEASTATDLNQLGTQVKIVDLQKRSAASIDEIIRTIPGLNLVSSPASGEIYISAAGVRPEGINVLIDGRKLNSLLTGKADLGQLPLKAVSRIEYYPSGAGSSGNGGLGGTINFVTASRSRPEKIEVNSGRGGFDEERYSVEANYRRDNIGTFNGLWESDYIRNDYIYNDVSGQGRKRENAHANHRRYFLSYSNEIAGNFVSLSGFVYQGRNGVPGRINAPSFEANSDKTTFSLGAGLSRQIDSRLEINSNLALTERNTDYEDYGSWIPYDTKYHEREIAYSTDSRLAISEWLSGTLSFSITSSLLDGRDILRPDKSLGRWLRDVYARSAGLNSGFRLSQLDFSGGLSYAVSNTDKGTYSSSSVGLAVVRDRPVKLGCSFSYSNAFRLPGLAELHWQEDIFALPNPELKPEKSHSALTELFSEFKLYGKWRLGLQYKDVRYRDLIYWRRSRGVQYQPVNVSRSDFFGTILTVSYASAGNIVKFDYSREVSQAINREQGRNFGKYITFQPPYVNRLNLSINYSNVSTNLEIYDSGKRYFLEGNTKALHPYTLVNVSSGFELKMKGVLTNYELKISNITDSQYELLEYQPMPPRSYYFGIGFKI